MTVFEVRRGAVLVVGTGLLLHLFVADRYVTTVLESSVRDSEDFAASREVELVRDALRRSQ